MRELILPCAYKAALLIAKSASGVEAPDPFQGFAPGPHWGTEVPQTPSIFSPRKNFLATPLRPTGPWTPLGDELKAAGNNKGWGFGGKERCLKGVGEETAEREGALKIDFYTPAYQIKFEDRTQT
jgi:hypothetical protein